MEDEAVTKKCGRPKDTIQEEAFLQIMANLEKNEEQIAIHNLIYNMKAYLGDSHRTSYGLTYMNRKIIACFGDNISITEINGKRNVVTFKSTASTILHEFHRHSKKDDSVEEQLRPMEAAPKLVRSDKVHLTTQRYFSHIRRKLMSAERAAAFLPESLRTLLHVLFSGIKCGINVASVGHAIIQAIYPRVLLCPL